MSFHQDLAFSKSNDDLMARISATYFGPAFDTYTVNDDVVLDKLGIDAFVSLVNGRRYAVDNKLDRYSNDTVCLEVWSSEESKKVGWALNLTLKTDFVVYVKLRGQYALVLPKQPLHNYTSAVLDTLPQLRANNAFYTSVSLAATTTDLIEQFGKVCHVKV